MTFLQLELLWWLRAIEAPLFLLLLWLVHGIKRDLDQRITHGDSLTSSGLQRTREDLAAFRLEVARTYVPLSLIRDVDQRLSTQLHRIEERLEELRVGQERAP
ncbi:MAG: hypothetical protein MUF65_04635 [Rubritepida sp.]|jgi:hypothetical protein|nr:hypothetical protein [Rubritepida sp.]MCU0944639.1 hypothetical protein [Rubritepida sp.]